MDWTNGRNERFPESTRVCCLDEPGEFADQVCDGAFFCLEARRKRIPYDRSAVRGLSAEAARRRPAIIHSHNLAAWQYAALAAGAPDAAHVYTQHGANVHNQSLANRFRSRMLARYTDRIVAVSESTRQAMYASFGIPVEQISVVPNGVELPPPIEPSRREALREKLGIAPDAIVVGSVGRLDAVKAYDRLVAAFAAIATEQSGAVLLLVGEGECRPTLEQQVSEAGLSDRVILAGRRSDARDLLRLMSLFVLPSRSEGLSVALLEAMAGEVPVLVTDVGESRAVVADGEAGFLLPDDDAQWPHTLSHALGQLGKCADMISSARARVAESYSLSATLDRYEAIYVDATASC